MSGELPNPKHEKVARYLSEGLAQDVAYEKAGFAYSKAAANLLCRRPHMRERVAQLVQEQEDNLTNEEMEVPDGEEILEDVNITRTWLLKQLSDNVLKSKRAGQFSASNKAIEMLGNYLGGMFDKPKGPAGSTANPVDPDAPKVATPDAMMAIMQMAQELNGLSDEITTQSKRLPPRVVNPITTEDED